VLAPLPAADLPEVDAALRDALAVAHLAVHVEAPLPAPLARSYSLWCLAASPRLVSVAASHPKHDYLAPHGGRRGMGEVLVRAFGYTVTARYLDNSEEMVRERYSHINTGKLGNLASETLGDVDN